MGEIVPVTTVVWIILKKLRNVPGSTQVHYPGKNEDPYLRGVNLGGVGWQDLILSRLVRRWFLIALGCSPVRRLLTEYITSKHDRSLELITGLLIITCSSMLSFSIACQINSSFRVVLVVSLLLYPIGRSAKRPSFHVHWNSSTLRHMRFFMLLYDKCLLLAVNIWLRRDYLPDTTPKNHRTSA